jgi:pyruvate kinase
MTGRIGLHLDGRWSYPDVQDGHASSLHSPASRIHADLGATYPCSTGKIQRSTFRSQWQIGRKTRSIREPELSVLTTPRVNTLAPLAPRRKMITSQNFRDRARTKIVATVGPACRDEEALADLVAAGVDVFRLNMAHGSRQEHEAVLNSIRGLEERLHHPIAVLVDLPGPKIRLGELPGESIQCRSGEEFFFVDGAATTNPHELTSTYEPLTRELSAGDRVMLADGTVSMMVEEREPGRVRLRVMQPGVIRSRQGINLPGVKLNVPALSDADREHAGWAARAGVDFVGLSFVRAADDVRTLQDLFRSLAAHVRVIAKIEKREALDQLDAIVEAADGVMVARGDLGVEIDVAEMAVEQKRIIKTCRRFQKPVIIATQMLDSMQNSSRPTRAEATDVANAILDGGDACMLSGETAIGRYPRETVAMMNRIALVTERSLQGRIPQKPSDDSRSPVHDITRGVVHGACQMAHELAAKLVVVASHSGRTALALSQHRSLVPTIGVSSSRETLRQMCLYWGVTPLEGAPARQIEKLIQHADEWGRRVGRLAPGDRIIIVGGSHLTAGPDDSSMTSGVHDVVIVHEVEA